MQVAFDFDNTLTIGEGKTFVGPNPVMINRLLEHHRSGDRVWIVTARDDKAGDLRSSRRKDAYDDPYGPWVHAFVWHWRLPVPTERIVFVGGRGKGPHLQSRRIEALYDDRASQRDSARRSGVRAVKPKYPSIAPDPVQLAARWQELFEELELDYSDELDAEQAAGVLSEESGLPVLGVGNTRAVFGLDPHRVLKLAFWHGEEDNLDEAILWEKSGAGARRRLAPVLDVDGAGYWLVMGRASPPSPADRERIRKGVFDPTARRLGLDDLRSSDNWGIYDGRLVIIDYGETL